MQKFQEGATVVFTISIVKERIPSRLEEEIPRLRLRMTLPHHREEPRFIGATRQPPGGSAIASLPPHYV
jgi:hypothetical protein